MRPTPYPPPQDRRLGRRLASTSLPLASAALILALAWTGAAAQDEAAIKRPELPALEDAQVPLPPRTDGELRAAVQELERAQASLAQLRRDALEKRTALQDRLKGLVRERQAASRGLQFYQDDLARKEKELTAKRADLEAKKSAAAELRRPAAGLTPIFDDFLAQLASHVREGIPWKLEERLGTLRQAREIVQGSGAAPGAALQVVGRIQQEEEALGRYVESAAELVTVAGEQKAVQAFHLGLLAVVYANDAGNVLGFAQQGQTLEDGIGAAAGHPAAEAGYLVAVDILRRRRTPTLVDLYLPALPVEEAK